VLSGDFTSLSPELMSAGIALSLAETLLPENKKGKTQNAKGKSKAQKRKT
jgi:hypothetical protein